MGIQGISVDKPQDLEAALVSAFAHNDPVPATQAMTRDRPSIRQ
jgi:thiamine pyrophosphate-dependent acetolactate synthase large subunit-like protein